ncbi:MAG TPA: molecular chaperone HtpG, partial [Flavobacteriaceae bacterium]|nr:molecular chaperone HtpG [Flavobacteriaceae bacterium]
PVKFVRVDADTIDNLIKKEEKTTSKLSDKEQEKLKGIIEGVVPNEKYSVQLEAMDSNANPFTITQPEFMRRMKEMQQSGGGGMMGMSNFPEMYNLVINTNNDWMQKILKAKAKQKDYINQALDLAKLSQNLLKGEDLTNFIKRSLDMMK